MPEDSQATSKTKPVLPYSATEDTINAVVEAVKLKSGDAKAIEQVYKGKMFKSTVKTLQQIGVLSQAYQFTPTGMEIAYGKDQHARYLRALMSYPPYEVLLLFVSQGEMTATDFEEIENYWARHDYGSSKSNRGDAVPTFAHLVKLAGLGQPVVGRKGANSRIEWAAGAKENITGFGKDSTPAPEPSVIEKPDTATEIIPPEDSLVADVVRADGSINIPHGVQVTVDMSNWELDKIAAFFEILRGKRDNG